MKYLPLILKHLRKNWIRTASTVMAMALCIFLFCTLETLINAITWNLKSASSTRLVSRHAVGLANNVPITYKQRIANVPGVKAVSASNWFGGRQGDDFKNFFPNMAVEPETWLPMYPEYELPEDQKQAWFNDLRGCIIGRKTAEKFGWKIGSRFQLESFIPPYRVPGKPFEFVVSGIFDADEVRNPGTDTTAMYFHWRYLYEATNQRVGAGTYTILIDDPNKAGQISKTIDSMFENSDPQTKTETEAAFRASFVSLAGNLALLLRGIGLAVTFTILLVTANTMSMAVRDRRNEIAVLKTLGYPSGLVMALIITEALILGIMGGAVGLLLSSGMIQALPSFPFIGDAVRGFPNLRLTAPVTGIGVGMALVLGFFAGFVPAFVAYRSKITEMLRQV
jgi:putative ABC transport system permease protein